MLDYLTKNLYEEFLLRFNYIENVSDYFEMKQKLERNLELMESLRKELDKKLSEVL